MAGSHFVCPSEHKAFLAARRTGVKRPRRPIADPDTCGGAIVCARCGETYRRRSRCATCLLRDAIARVTGIDARASTEKLVRAVAAKARSLIYALRWLEHPAHRTVLMKLQQGQRIVEADFGDAGRPIRGTKVRTLLVALRLYDPDPQDYSRFLAWYAQQCDALPTAEGVILRQFVQMFLIPHRLRILENTRIAHASTDRALHVITKAVIAFLEKLRACDLSLKTLTRSQLEETVTTRVDAQHLALFLRFAASHGLTRRGLSISYACAALDICSHKEMEETIARIEACGDPSLQFSGGLIAVYAQFVSDIVDVRVRDVVVEPSGELCLTCGPGIIPLVEPYVSAFRRLATGKSPDDFLFPHRHLPGCHLSRACLFLALHKSGLFGAGILRVRYTAYLSLIARAGATTVSRVLGRTLSNSFRARKRIRGVEHVAYLATLTGR